MAAKPKAVIILGVLAVAVAAVAAYFLYGYLRGQEERVKEAVASEKVVAAAAVIPLGSAINATQLKIVDWPKTSVPQGAFLTTEQVTGRVAIQTFLPGDPIIEAKLIPKGGQTTGILTYMIPEGHRAMTVGVDQVAGVAGFITPGSMVDVVLTITPIGATQILSKIVLQNIPILATGQTIEQKEGNAVVVPTVTMDVTPEDAENLAIASTQGRLQLVLRRAGDKEIAKTSGSTVTRVISGVGAPVTSVKAAPSKARPKAVSKVPVRQTKQEEPKKPVEQGVSVEVWIGGKKTAETFK
jgi:pilus assembly protein CpaB